LKKKTGKSPLKQGKSSSSIPGRDLGKKDWREFGKGRPEKGKHHQ